MTSADDPTSTRPSDWVFWVGLGFYALMRLALLPPPNPALGGFGHDSAYICLVAQNLLAGRGYVNDAHWLVFLQPGELPMPYHNANPLYPTLIAGLSGLTGINTITSGYAISALAHVLLLAGLFWLLGAYVAELQARVLLTVAGGFFPAVFEGTLFVLADSLCSACSVWLVACLVRSRGLGGAAGAGLFLGLAWLARSSAILMLPAVLVLLIGREGWRAALRRLGIAGLVAALVCSPWLWHTYVVWGHPLRSDASYYLLQDYLAKSHRNDIERYWHSIDMPPSLGELARREPGPLLWHWLTGLRITPYILLSKFSYGHRILAVLLVMLTLYPIGKFLFLSDLRHRFLPEMTASALYAMTLIGVFALRYSSLETRYFAVLALLLALLLAAAVWGLVLGWRAGRRLLVGPLLLAAGGIWLVFVPFLDVRHYWESRLRQPERGEYFDLVRKVHTRFDGQGPMVVGFAPYFYTLATGVPALAIPEAGDDYLRSYMERYGVQQVFLTQPEIEFWRPRWLEPGGLPKWLTKAADLGSARVYQRKEPP